MGRLRWLHRGLGGQPSDLGASVSVYKNLNWKIAERRKAKKELSTFLSVEFAVEDSFNHRRRSRRLVTEGGWIGEGDITFQPSALCAIHLIPETLNSDTTPQLYPIMVVMR